MRPHEVLHNISRSLALIVSGAHVLTLRDDSDQLRAIVVSFVQQIGFEPPRIAVALYKEREIIAALEKRRAFVLNILAAGSEALCDDLGSLPGDPGAALRALAVRACGPGVVLDSAAGHLVCNVLERVDIRDHWLYICDVVDGAAVAERQPLVHTRRSGLRY